MSPSETSTFQSKRRALGRVYFFSQDDTPENHPVIEPIQYEGTIPLSPLSTLRKEEQMCGKNELSALVSFPIIGPG